MDRLTALPDDALAAILHLACKPVPWPWATDACLLNNRCHALCHARRTRGWYLAYASRDTRQSTACPGTIASRCTVAPCAAATASTSASTWR